MAHAENINVRIKIKPSAQPEFPVGALIRLYDHDGSLLGKVSASPRPAGYEQAARLWDLWDSTNPAPSSSYVEALADLARTMGLEVVGPTLRECESDLLGTETNEVDGLSQLPHFRVPGTCFQVCSNCGSVRHVSDGFLQGVSSAQHLDSSSPVGVARTPDPTEEGPSPSPESVEGGEPS